MTTDNLSNITNNHSKLEKTFVYTDGLLDLVLQSLKESLTCCNPSSFCKAHSQSTGYVCQILHFVEWLTKVDI